MNHQKQNAKKNQAKGNRYLANLWNCKATNLKTDYLCSGHCYVPQGPSLGLKNLFPVGVLLAVTIFGNFYSLKRKFLPTVQFLLNPTAFPSLPKALVPRVFLNKLPAHWLYIRVCMLGHPTYNGWFESPAV